jgi:hypothetical protein
MDATITFYLGLTAGLRSGKAKVMQHMKQRGVSREQREVVWQQVLELKTPVLNDGEHWTDWFPLSKKEEIVALFSAIPTKSGKVKRPFMREMPPELHERRKERIKKAALKERDTAQALLNVQPDDARNQAKVSKIDAALKAFDEMCKTDYVPRTWHGMVDMGDE